MIFLNSRDKCQLLLLFWIEENISHKIYLILKNVIFYLFQRNLKVFSLSQKFKFIVWYCFTFLIKILQMYIVFGTFFYKSSKIDEKCIIYKKNVEGELWMAFHRLYKLNDVRILIYTSLDIYRISSRYLDVKNVS